MERKGKTKRRGCSCLRFVKVMFLLLATLLLLNMIIGLNFDKLGIRSVMKNISSYLVPTREEHFRARSRLQDIDDQYNNQCQREPNPFSGSYNKTLYFYANLDMDEARMEYALTEMLEDRFRISFDRLLRIFKFPFIRTRFISGLKMLAKNLLMDYDPRVLQELVTKVKMHIDKHYQSISNSAKVNVSQRYTTCAVIGNSGELLNSTRGKFIDEHEAVIRVNNARPNWSNLPNPLKAYIGTKTTIMFMNSHVLHQCTRRQKCRCHPYGVKVPIVLYLCNTEHILDVTVCASEHKTPLFLTDRRFDLLATKIARWYSLRRFFDSKEGFRVSKWRHWELLHDWEMQHKLEFHYSTGMQAVLFALGICEQVDLLGFGKDPNLSHHFHTLQETEYYGHDFDAEYLFYNDLVNGRVNANPFLCEAKTYIPPVRVFH